MPDLSSNNPGDKFRTRAVLSTGSDRSRKLLSAQRAEPEPEPRGFHESKWLIEKAKMALSTERAELY